jgi:hypothetical protein
VELSTIDKILWAPYLQEKCLPPPSLVLFEAYYQRIDVILPEVTFIYKLTSTLVLNKYEPNIRKMGHQFRKLLGSFPDKTKTFFYTPQRSNQFWGSTNLLYRGLRGSFPASSTVRTGSHLESR